MQIIRDNLRIIVIGAVGMLLLCLIGFLLYNVFTSGGNSAVTSAPAADPTENIVEDLPTVPVDDPTPTATRVLAEAIDPTPPEATEASESVAEAEAGEEAAEFTPGEADEGAAVASEPTNGARSLAPTSTLALVPTATQIPRTTAAPSSQQVAPASDGNGADNMTAGGASVPANQATEDGVSVEPAIDNLLRNGDFEEGFRGPGIALEWDFFTNGGAAIGFTQQEFDLLVKSGAAAQQISIAGAQTENRYGGIFQRIDVIPGETYTLQLNGLIRTSQGDVEATSYGHRMEYALDETGNTNWQRVDDDEWIELPWDEKSLSTVDTPYLAFTTEFVPNSDEVTLFIRGWNKWPVPDLAEYTLDSLSLIGPVPGTTAQPLPAGIPAASSEVPAGGGEAEFVSPTATPMVDEPLPTTGIALTETLASDGRVWGAVFVLVLLGAGAIYRGRWRT